VSDPCITKQAAAQRQIDTAIRMLFLHGEDFTAIHTIAAAARTIVKDLADARGIGHLGTHRALEQMHRDALAAVARSAETGDTIEEVHREMLAEAVAAVNKGVTAEKVSFELADLELTNPKIAADIDRRARAIEDRKSKTQGFRNKAANFLKHADKDPNNSLHLSDLNVFGIIVHAIDLWTEMNLPLTDEMEVYYKWFCGVAADNPEEFIATKDGPIHLVAFAQQIDFGGHMLKSALRTERRSTTQFRDDTVYRPGDIKMYCALE
jgi:hypothetical protein